MAYLEAGDFFLRARKAYRVRIKLDPYLGYQFQCACGDVHVFDNLKVVAIAELAPMKLILGCPHGNHITCVKIRGLIRFKGLESLFGTAMPISDEGNKEVETCYEGPELPLPGQPILDAACRIVRRGSVTPERYIADPRYALWFACWSVAIIVSGEGEWQRATATAGEDVETLRDLLSQAGFDLERLTTGETIDRFNYAVQSTKELFPDVAARYGG